MYIIKRTGREEVYTKVKIQEAMNKACISTGVAVDEQLLILMTCSVENEIASSYKNGNSVTVEHVQDIVEKTLMANGLFDVAKLYILYRNERTKLREARNRILDAIPHNCEEEKTTLSDVLKQIQKDYPEESYSLHDMYQKFHTFHIPGANRDTTLKTLVRSALELTVQEAPHWEFISARLSLFRFNEQLNPLLKNLSIDSLYDKISHLTSIGLYGEYILESYSKEEIDEFETYMDKDRDLLLTYSSLDLLLHRYAIKTHNHEVLETPQELFLGIALHLAMKETDNRSTWVRSFYDILSRLEVTVATPTLSNARKPFHQLSSCFIDTVPDSLDGIYRSIDNFAKVSKFGGGMGLYFGKIRATGSTIRGFKGVGGGVIRWIKLANDTAVAVDQLGVRQGSVAVYLDAWHKDLPEFLSMKTNNGDDRMKAHDVFPAVCYPDLFWKTVRDDMDAMWNLFCPHEVLTLKGYSLEDSWGQEWEEKYNDCVNDENLSRRQIPIKDLVRLIIKSAVETGTPFAFNRDAVNRMNPNGHKGIIYSSNLCTEIAQNMSPIELLREEIKTEDGDMIVVETTRPGDFVVCNLASLVLGNIDLETEGELERITKVAIRALDNVIDLNYYPVPYAKITNQKYRALGLGVSGYHHALVKANIQWEHDEHLFYADKLFERINFSAIWASNSIAIEKGSYQHFEGSDWHTGAFFDKRSYTGDAWASLRSSVAKNGMRNGYLLAVAPTSSTSIVAGTTAGIDPVMKRYFLEEKKGLTVPRVAPGLNNETFLLYKNAHVIDQHWSLKAAGIRQRHIDQGQSLNIYITTEFSLRQVLDLYIAGWEAGVKTIYYIRAQSLEIEECESCMA